VFAFIGGISGSIQATDWGNLGKSLLNDAIGPSSKTKSNSLSGISNGQVADAFKQALSIGSTNVVSKLGQTGGFLNDANVRIPLPSSLASVQRGLKAAGMSHMLDDLETKLNSAAEIATPHAKELFLGAISEMTFDDVMNIYNGPQDSATQYFQSKMSAPLGEKMSPFVTNALGEAGAVKAYDNVMGQYSQIPFMPNVKANLTDYVVDEGIEGIFYYLAKEEAAIRANPVRQTTELLKTVFGQ